VVFILLDNGHDDTIKDKEKKKARERKKKKNRVNEKMSLD